MPATATSKSAGAAERQAVLPLVEIEGLGQCTGLYCTHIENNTGLLPSKAFLSMVGTTGELQSPITLNAYNWDKFAPGARCKVSANGQLVHLGQVWPRNDQGKADSIVFESHDDKLLLAALPILGCLVYDPLASQVIFLTGYEHRVNPGGFRNCVGAQVPGVGLVPVFSHVAEAADDERVDEDIGSTLQAGTLRSWTPRLHLQYLRALANLARGSVPGTDIDAWRSLYTASRIAWDESSLNLPACDALDHKMPDMSFRAKRILGALQQTLDNAKSWGLKLELRNEKSYVAFYSSDEKYATVTKSLPLQRGGVADNINTIHDFNLSEDPTELIESCVALGDRNKIEGEVKFSNAAGDTLVTAWTADEERIAKTIVWGSTDPNTQGNYAWIPVDANNPATGFVPADGSSAAQPLIKACTPEAIALMRQLLPRVFRAYRLDSDAMYSAGLLQGSGGKFSNAGAWPHLKTQRPILNNQLSYIVDTSGQKLKQYWPTRVQIETRKDSDNYEDVTYNSGLRVERDGLIYVDGLTDDSGGKFNVYDGSLMGAPWTIRLRKIKMNVAFPCDHRVLGYFEAKGDMAATLASELGGPFMALIDSPESWRYLDRVNSSPMAASQATRSTGTESYPVTGVLLDETASATRHAKQRVDRNKRTKKLSAWRLIGIRTDYNVGDFIDYVRMRGGVAGDSDYKIGAPLESVVFDFLNQETRAGGLMSRGTVEESSGSEAATPATSTRSGASVVSSSSGGSPAPSSSGYQEPASAAQSSGYQSGASSSQSQPSASMPSSSGGSPGETGAAPVRTGPPDGQPDAGKPVSSGRVEQSGAGMRADPASKAGTATTDGAPRKGQILGPEEMAARDRDAALFGNNARGIFTGEQARSRGDDMIAKHYGQGQAGMTLPGQGREEWNKTPSAQDRINAGAKGAVVSGNQAPEGGSREQAGPQPATAQPLNDKTRASIADYDKRQSAQNKMQRSAFEENANASAGTIRAGIK